MDHDDGPDNLITYDLATLTWSEVLRARLRGRFPAPEILFVGGSWPSWA